MKKHITMKLNNTFKHIALAAFAGLALTACDDFL